MQQRKRDFDLSKHAGRDKKGLTETSKFQGGSNVMGSSYEVFYLVEKIRDLAKAGKSQQNLFDVVRKTTNML